MQHLLEAIVELSGPLSLSSSVLESLSNEGSDVRIVGLLPAAIDALHALCCELVATRGHTQPLAPAAADAPPAQLITADSVAPPHLDRSTADRWRASLDAQTGATS